MRFLKHALVGAMALACALPAFAADNSLTVKNVAGATVYVCGKDIGGGVMASCAAPVNTAGTRINPATSDKQPALGTAGSAASDVLTVQGIASMTALKVDGSATTQPVSAASLPLPSGAATSALQTTGNGYLSTLAGAVSAGNVQVVCTSGCSGGGGGSGYSVLNDSTFANSSSYSNVPAGGLVGTSAPTFTNGHASPLSLNTSGGLRVDGSGVTQPVSAASLPLPTGAATATKQPALGTAGTASSDVLTVQGIASMTALKVDGSATTQPVSASALPLPTGAATAANQTTELSSLSTIATNTTNAGAPSVAQDGAGNVKIIQANATAAIDVNTATTTQLVALSSGKKIYVTNWNALAGGTGNVTFKYGTGTNCGTGTTSLTGAYNLTAQAGAVVGGGLGPVLIVPASNALCITTSAAVQVSGSVAYAQF